MNFRPLLALAVLVPLFQADTGSTTNLCIVDPGTSSATSAAGILFACPGGDGDLLSDKGLTITVVVKACLSQEPIPGIPATDMWVIGCNPNALLWCQPSTPFPAGQTNAEGVVVLDGRVAASGCDNSGLRVVVMGYALESCLNIQTRTPDLKSAGTPGPPPCGGDALCPDRRVTLADFTFFATHYPATNNPSASYLACLDFAFPYGGQLGLGDLAKLSAHLLGSEHHCP